MTIPIKNFMHLSILGRGRKRAIDESAFYQNF